MTFTLVNRLGYNLQKFHLITFDVTDTLLKFSMPPAVQYAKTAASFGYSNINQDKLHQAFKIEFKKMSLLNPNFGANSHMDWKAWWFQLVKNIFNNAAEPKIPNVDLEKIANQLVLQYRTAECWRKITGADDIIQKFKNLDKIIGLISNFDSSLCDIIHVMELPKLDFILTSYETGIPKPNKEIFSKALELASKLKGVEIEPKKALHIGNTLELDYIGAIKSNWCSLLIGNPEIMDKRVNRDHVFNSLENLTESLENNEIKW